MLRCNTDESYGDNLPTLPVQRVCVTHVIFFLCDTNLSVFISLQPLHFYIRYHRRAHHIAATHSHSPTCSPFSIPPEIEQQQQVRSS